MVGFGFVQGLHPGFQIGLKVDCIIGGNLGEDTRFFSLLLSLEEVCFVVAQLFIDVYCFFG